MCSQNLRHIGQKEFLYALLFSQPSPVLSGFGGCVGLEATLHGSWCSCLIGRGCNQNRSCKAVGTSPSVSGPHSKGRLLTRSCGGRGGRSFPNTCEALGLNRSEGRPRDRPPSKQAAISVNNLCPPSEIRAAGYSLTLCLSSSTLL